MPANGNAAFTGEHNVAIPGLAPAQTCYNCGMASYRGKQLVALRVDDPTAHGARLTQHIAMVELDAQWRACAPLAWLKAKPGRGVLSTDEDPRLAVVGDNLYIIYNMAHGVARRMHVARIEVGQDGRGLSTFKLCDDKMLDFTEGAPEGWEKNWTPFDYDGILHLAYTLNPPMVLRLKHEKIASPGASLVPEVLSRATSQVRWDFGTIRGGTQALFDPSLQRYVAFFHSSAPATGRQGVARYYVMGFCTFAPHPPFAIDRLVRAPLVAAGFYTYAANLVPYNVSVIFPQGIIDARDTWHVMYGQDDRTLHVATLDKTRLLGQCEPPKPVSEKNAHYQR